MNFITNHSLARAQHVLDYLENDSRLSNFNSSMRIGSYQNGREQGLSLELIEGRNIIYFFFSEHKGTDDVVVYVSKVNSSQSIACEKYENLKKFHNEVQAADFIVKKILEFYKKN